VVHVSVATGARVCAGGDGEGARQPAARAHAPDGARRMERPNGQCKEV